jgi:arylsulfatase A
MRQARFLLPLAALALLLATLQTSQAAEQNRPPNFVLILVDDLGWMDLSCQGSQFFETPHIDRLAAQGMRLTNGYAACAVCSPTRAAVQTGRYPSRVGVTDWIRSKFQGGIIGPDGNNPTGYVGGPNQPVLCPKNALFMESDEVTLAELLGPAGYATCHIGKWHLGQADHFPEKQGYDLNHGGCDLGQPPNYFDPYESTREFYEIPNLPSRTPGEYLSDREADEAVKFIRDNRDQPFFLNMDHYAVHTPLQAKPDVKARYEAKEKTTKQTNATYAAMVESVDDSTGRIMETLKEYGLADNTVIIFTSDNGGLLGPTNNEPLRSGKGFPYEGGIRVPLIVRWPGVVAAASTSDVPVTSVDYFPTLAQIAQVELPNDRAIDGQSIVPVLKQQGTLDRDAIFWHFPHFRGKLGPYSIVRQGDWKLIKRYAEGKRELYNLADDLSETTDLAAEMPERVNQLDTVLQAWLEETGSKMPKANPDYQAKP